MKKLIKQILAVILGLGIVSPLYATEIINNVSSSASTGGNSASLGEVIQGESKASVKIYTEIDGEIITDIDEEVTGSEAKIEKSVNVISSADLEQASSSEIQGKTLQSGKAPEEKNNVIIAFLNKIFNYVLSIFS